MSLIHLLLTNIRYSLKVRNSGPNFEAYTQTYFCSTYTARDSSILSGFWIEIIMKSIERISMYASDENSKIYHEKPGHFHTIWIISFDACKSFDCIVASINTIAIMMFFYRPSYRFHGNDMCCKGGLKTLSIWSLHR